MKIYLAGSCSKDDRENMTAIAEALRAESYTVYCPFELKIENAWDYSQEEWAKKVFDCDTMAIDNCDFMVMISRGRHSTAGTNWEQGYAYAKGKPVFVFQMTMWETSLMTYWGCTVFKNIPKDYDRETRLNTIAKFPYEDRIRSKRERSVRYDRCYTTLT